VTSKTSEYDSLAVAGIIQSNVLNSRCESVLEDSTVACYEATGETSSITEMSSDTIIACSASRYMP